MRQIAVCKDTAGGLHCSIVVAGDEEEQVVEVAAGHMESVHGLADTPALRRSILKALRVQEEFLPEDDWEVVHAHAHPHPEQDVEDETVWRRRPVPE
jgi:predicted small metal-binding protein